MAAAVAEDGEQSLHLFPVLSMRHGVIRTITVLLAGFIAATVWVELLFQVLLATPLRWALPVPPVALYGPDASTGYRHRANVSGMWLTEHRAFIRTSNLGLRDRDRNLAHGSGPRAIVIGNSFVEALQVELPHTAAAVAERILVRDRPAAEVVNLGLAGARPAVEVARLASQGLALTPDLAVVVLQADEIATPSAIDDSEFTGYRRGADGAFHLSYGFRASRGYRFRTSVAGRAFYWLLDHSQVARILNGRRNVGVLAEWPQSAVAPTLAMAATCAPNALDDHIALWIDARPAEGRAILDAFIRDLGAIGREHRLPIVVATRAIEARCPELATKRATLIDAIRATLDAAGLEFVDLDARVVAKVGRDGVAQLQGFGATLGSGHLNIDGNRIYGEIYAAIIDEALLRR
jgi:hypothetical protein